VDQATLIAQKDQLIAEQALRIELLEAELADLKRLIYGQKRERFIPQADPAQLQLDLGELAPAATQAETQEVSYERKKTSKKRPNHPGRTLLPEHLPRKVIQIEPDVDTTGMVKIGEEVTETLEIEEARFFVRREVRPKYLETLPDEQAGPQSRIHIAAQPQRPLPKTMAGISVLVHLLMSKYADHLPLYRQGKIFQREEGLNIARSTLSHWIASVCDLLEPLYEQLKKEVLKQIYLMADESRIEVLDKNKKGKTHRGYMWVYLAPLTQLVFFDYQKGRGKQYPKETLMHFRGYLQTDGYEVYDNLFEDKAGVALLGCMAHARRYFDKALQQDKQRASHAMSLIQKLYDIERRAKEAQLCPEQRYTLRQQEALPLLDKLKTWTLEQYQQVLPKSRIGQAIAYYLRREEKLRKYTSDGRLEIDNNYVENRIRPLALGRKNYLFAGSHQGAIRAAMIYSFIGSCEKNGINPREWLNDVLHRIPSHSISKLHELLPPLWQPSI